MVDSWDRTLRGPIRLTWLRVLVVTTLVLATLVALVWTWVTVRTDPTSHVAVLDSLAIPSDWQLVHSDTHQDLMFGSRVTRRYVVDADPEDVVGPATRMLAAAGHPVVPDRASSNWCDTRPIGATPAVACPVKTFPPCHQNGGSGPTTCGLSAEAGDDSLQIVVFDRGERDTVSVDGEPTYIGAPNMSVVRVSISDH